MLTAKQQWLLIGRFAVVGPLVGAAFGGLGLVALASGEVASKGESLWAWGLQFLYLGLPFIVGLGYWYGLVPAILAGVTSAVIFKSSVTSSRLFGLVLASAALAFSNAYLLNPLLGFAAEVAGCGALSAAVCAWLFVLRRSGA